jgi:hypothetical protein
MTVPRGCHKKLRIRWWRALSPVLLLLTTCSRDVLNLGKAGFPYAFDPPGLIAELIVSGTQNNNPTLTGDLLEIYFTTGGMSTPQEVWVAQRSSRTEPFRSPTLVVAASAPEVRETSSAISPDGLTLWFASERAGGLGDLDVWRTTRADTGSAWSVPTNLANLNSASRDLPRPPGLHGLAMPVASDRAAPPAYRTMIARRASVAEEFDLPVPIPELADLDDAVDGFMTDDGLLLFLSIGSPGDLFVVQRFSETERFGAPIALNALNTADAESDPWWSPDRTEFYFTSERGDGTRQIYRSTVHRRTP